MLNGPEEMTQGSLFRFKLLYFVQFTAYGLLAPYIPIFFEDLGMSKSEIGILTMLPNMCTFMVAPLFGFVGKNKKRTYTLSRALTLSFF